MKTVEISSEFFEIISKNDVIEEIELQKYFIQLPAEQWLIGEVSVDRVVMFIETETNFKEVYVDNLVLENIYIEDIDLKKLDIEISEDCKSLFLEKIREEIIKNFD